MVLTESKVDRTIVCLRGEHDAFTAGALSETIAAATARGQGDLVVDLSAVEFMSAATVRVFLQARERLLLQSRSLVLRSPRRAQRVLDLCGIADRFEPAAGGGP